MLKLLQPLFALLLGLAVAVLGAVHAVATLPGPLVWSAAVSSLPTIAAVLLFVVCVLAAGVGVALVVTAARSATRRAKLLRRVDWSDAERRARRRPTYVDDDPYEPRYA